MDTIAALASAPGGRSALLRLSGPAARAVAAAARVPVGEPWRLATADWPLPPGPCPCRSVFMPGPRSATGCDTVEICIPGAADLAELALAALYAAGAVPAAPGAFTRQAVANRRLSLDQAEALLALVHAGDAQAAGRALVRLRGGLGAACAVVRERLLALRALVEVGLDFAEEDGVRPLPPARAAAEAAALAGELEPWRAAVASLETTPTVLLVGPPNAGKSALFARLTGEAALVSPQPGTTRDWLDGVWSPGGRRLRLIDTAGWLAAAQGADAEAIAAGRAQVAGAALVLACSAPDAPLPAAPDLPQERTLVIATKADLGGADRRAALAVSVHTGEGLERLAALVAGRLAGEADGEPRQQRLLAEAIAALRAIAARPPADELLAEELARAATALGDLIGATTPDDVLGAVFSRFCIGK